MKVAAVKRAHSGAIGGLEAACRLTDIAPTAKVMETQIERERFFSLVQHITNAVSACIEAQATLDSYIAVFGDANLSTDDGEGEVAE